MVDAVVAALEQMGGRLFCALPTTADIVNLDVIDGFLLALDSDGRCWVIDEHGEVVTSFLRSSTP